MLSNIEQYRAISSNMEQYRETGEREGEAQNTTLHAKFAKFSRKPSIDSREPSVSNQNTTFLNVSFRVSSVPDFLDDGSRQFRIIRFVKEVNAGFCG